MLKKGKSTVIVERKQFRVILGHAIIAYKSQGSTLDYMQGDFSIHRQENCNRKGLSATYISGSVLHLSRVKSRDKVFLLNVNLEDIKVN